MHWQEVGGRKKKDHKLFSMFGFAASAVEPAQATDLPCSCRGFRVPCLLLPEAAHVFWMTWTGLPPM